MSTFTRTAAIVALVLTLAGCGAGKDAATLKPYAPTDGAQGSAQSVKVRDVVLVAMPDGTGVIVGTVVQTGETQDQIVGITVDGRPAIVFPASPVLTQNAPVRFAGDSANASADVPALSATPGNTVKIEFTFGISGTVTLNAIVRDNTGDFAGVSSAPLNG